MYRNPLDTVRLFLSLFQDLPPLARTIYVPGAILLLVYPILTVLLGHGHQGEAFVTSFMIALALRMALGFEGMVKRMMSGYSLVQTVLQSLLFVTIPLVALSFAEDPLACQRLQSAIYLLIGAVFLSDVVKGRVATAASFWPDADMRSYLPNLTRVMVIYNFAFLLLNETLIQTVSASYWLLFWAVLPVVAQIVLRALVLTVINLEDDGQHA